MNYFKKKINILLLSTLIIIIFPGIVIGASWSETQVLSVNISPHATLEISEDINIFSEQPWSNGSIKEERTGLLLKNNIEVNLSWVSSEIKDETGRALPLGISSNNNLSKNNTESFGLTASLVSKGVNLNDRNSNIMASKLDEKSNILRSSKEYKFTPGEHYLDIVISYFWNANGAWSEIRAGDYSGEIIYTISAVED